MSTQALSWINHLRHNNYCTLIHQENPVLFCFFSKSNILGLMCTKYHDNIKFVFYICNLIYTDCYSNESGPFYTV